MAIFGLFGNNKDKKNTDVNNANKAQIISLISQTQMVCKDATALGTLRSIQTQLQGQGESSKSELLAIDNEILSLVTDAHKFILKQQYPTAITKLAKALDKTIDRSQYCMMGGQMTKGDAKRAKEAEKLRDKIAAEPKSRLEELQAQIDEKNAELDSLNAEFERLKGLYTANPTNASIIAQANTVKSKIATTKNLINTLTIELTAESQNQAIVDVASTNETIANSRSFNETEMEINRAKLQAQNEECNALSEQIAMNNSVLSAGMEDMFANPFADETSSAASVFNPFADTVSTGSTASASSKGQAQTQYGGFDASEVGSAAMATDIRRAAQAIQNSIDAFNDKIEDANDELSDYNAELRPLLQRRETASPSDCLALDGQIDQINAKRNSVIYKIKRFRQAQAQLNDKLALLDKLSAQQDLSATDKQIEQLTGGKFTDFAGLAMFLNDSVKASNEELEEIGTAISVAESEEIIMNSQSATAAALSDAGALGKDEHKYDALKQDIGLTLQI